MRVMKKGGKNSLGLLLSSLFNNFFRFLYFLVNFLIFVGETARKIKGFAIRLILGMVRWILKLVSKFRFPSPPKIAIPKIKIHLGFLDNLSIKLRYFFLGSFLTIVILFFYHFSFSSSCLSRSFFCSKNLMTGKTGQK